MPLLLTDPDTYLAYPSLEDLPALVRKQRRLEARIAPIAPLVEEEKALRATIDQKLVALGFGRGEGVTCLGYEVTHHDRKGATSLNAEQLTEALVAAGVDRSVVDRAIVASTITGDPPQWASVKPCKGAKVRTS